jgi:tetratricopeptide (TPR) repeat protein
MSENQPRSASAGVLADGLGPEEVDQRCQTAATLQRDGKLTEALTLLEETVRSAPQNAEAHNALGEILIACWQEVRAVASLREAIRLKPLFTKAHINLGTALRNLTRYQEALQCFQTALGIDSKDCTARTMLAYVLAIQGRIDEALAEFRTVLKQDPHNPMAIARLADLAATAGRGIHDEQIRLMEALTARKDLPLKDRCRLHYALASLLDKAGKYDEAFDHCRRANEACKELNRTGGVSFDSAEVREFVDSSLVIFSVDYFERVQSFGVSSELPVFIIGMPRSGTTLVEQILASHPRIHGWCPPRIANLLLPEWGQLVSFRAGE